MDFLQLCFYCGLLLISCGKDMKCFLQAGFLNTEIVLLHEIATTGYSGAPLLKKLGIKPEMKLLLVNPPDNYYSLLEVSVKDQLVKKNEVPDLIHLFARNNKEFEAEMKKLKAVCKKNPAITIWVSWYKKSAKIP